MGCNSSSIQDYRSFIHRKPVIWFINGGPGSNKGRIIQFLIRDYKFKYLSSYDIIQFQRQRNGLDAQSIIQFIKNKKQFPSDLVVRLIKKAIASCGPRRFLIDNFPRNMSDVKEFQKQLTIKDIEFKKLIQIQVTDQKMKQSGLQANKDSKKSKQELQKQIDQIISLYRTSTNNILSYYKSTNKLILVSSTGQDQTYRDLRLQFNNLNEQTPENVKFFFANFDDEKLQISYCDDLVRKYGLYYYSIERMIKQIKMKNNKDKQLILEFQKNSSSIPCSLLLNLIRKKLQKKDYSGIFLITGFPRTINDAQQWDRYFGWQTSVQGYLNFQLSQHKLAELFKESRKSESNQQNKQKKTQQFLTGYIKNKRIISQFYKKQEKLLSINSQKIQLSQIDYFFSKHGVKSRKLKNKKNICFVSTITNNASIINLQQKNWTTLNMTYIYDNQIKEQNIYSDLIKSYYSLGRPVPADISVRLLLKAIQTENNQNLLIKGFPNSIDQFLTWDEQIGSQMNIPKIILFQINKDLMKQHFLQKKIQFKEQLIQLLVQNQKQLQDIICSSDWKWTKISRTSAKLKQEIFNFIK